MKWFYDLKIAHKLNAAFATILVFIVALGGFSIFQLAAVNQASSDLASNWLPSIRTLSQMAISMSRTRSFDLQRILATDAKEQEYLEQSAAAQLAKLRELNAQYAKLVSEPREKELYPEIARSVQAYPGIHERIVALLRAGQTEQAQQLLKAESTPLFRQTINHIDELIAVNDKGAAASDVDAVKTFRKSQLAIGMAVGACVMLALWLSWWVARLVSRPLVSALGVARQVAQGDLTAEIPQAYGDETGQLLEALKAMNQNLHKIVREVRLGTDTITTASSEIACGNMDLSSRTEQQAGSLEETASAMEEMTSTVRQNADNARQANQLAVSASEIAQAGGDVVNQVVGTMRAINESSRKIADIIGVIDGIAFQTNILALNAAVEAARAGEQGRGFAVVAAEVRTLAQRSAAAAQQVKVLIDDSVTKVASGSKLVNEAGATMSEVVVSVRQVTDIVAEITAASDEQRQGIEQINNAITHMDEATQQNAALVEQAAAAASALQEEQASRLSQTVSVFRLDNCMAVVPVPPVERDVTPGMPAIAGQKKPRLPGASKSMVIAGDAGWEKF